MDEERAYVAVLLVHLHFPDAGSLKAKRGELKSVKALLHGRFGAAVAEVGHQDRWQRSTLAVALTGGEAGRLDDLVDGVGRFLDARFEHGARVDRTVVSVADLGLT